MNIDDNKFTKLFNVDSQNIIRIPLEQLRECIEPEFLKSDLSQYFINCSYYDSDDFKNMCNKNLINNKFSIFHTNI